MTREELIRRHFTRDMRLLEIGPSYQPIVPKADGWRATVVDHAGQADLVTKYTAMGVATVDKIEPVDFIWEGGPLTTLIPQTMHGAYDGLIASHVGEHLPDLIAFFQDASTLMKPDGVMALALPDKRVCFDFFQPLTTTGDLVAAHADGRNRHQRKTFFNHAAYFVTRNNAIAWAHAGDNGAFCLPNPLSLAQLSFNSADERPTSEYHDNHAWAFTPKSFELIMLELNLLGHIDWAIRAIEPALGVEFYVWLERKRIMMPEVAINPLRLSLLTAMMYESKGAIAQLETYETAKLVLRSEPSVAVVIPLYNGSRYVEQALNSVLKQSLPATEIIVVNDGSTDGGAGAAIIERMARTHRLTLLHKQNGGQSSARNLGVRESRSDLIAFLDQDDLWYENHLEELVKPFRKASGPPVGWVYSNLDEIDENGFMICRSFLSTLLAPHPKQNIFDCIRQDMYILPSASLISRRAFLDVGGFDEQLCGYEDDDLFMRMFRNGYDSVYLECPLSQWRIYPWSTSYTSRMALSRSVYARKLLAMFPNDIERARYYIRDLIVPRFLDPAMREYERAVLQGDPDAAAAAWDEVFYLTKLQEDMALPSDLPSRLVTHTLDRYKDALLKGDKAGIAAAWRETVEVVERLPNARRRLRTILNLLRNPIVSRLAFALRRIARPAMLWAFNH